MNETLLGTLCRTPGIPGRENARSEFIKQWLTPHATEVRTDAIGNIFFKKNGSSATPRRIMFSAHTDEIAFVVRYISKEGFLYVNPLGGFDPRVLVAQRVKIYSKQVFDGIFGIKPTHFTTPEERNKVIQLEDMFIDTGYPADFVHANISIGDMITLERDLIRMGDFYTAKTLDDNIGMLVMMEAFTKLEGNQDDVYAVATVQEEVGVRGAKAAAFSLDPHVGVALDITIAADIPGVEERNWCVKMGAGVGIKVMDSYSISHHGLVQHIKALAERINIPYQMEVLPKGGTDAGGMQLARHGIPVISLSIPCRYTHSVVECVHKTDVQAAIDLTLAFMKHSADFTW